MGYWGCRVNMIYHRNKKFGKGRQLIVLQPLPKSKCYVKYIPILLKTIGNSSVYIAWGSWEVTKVVVTTNPIGAV